VSETVKAKFVVCAIQRKISEALESEEFGFILQE